MDDELRDALELLVARNNAGDLVDRWTDEGGYRSEALEKALDVIEAFLSGD